MSKYHISRSGKVAICKAKQNCPLGTYFDNKGEANSFLETSMSEDLKLKTYREEEREYTIEDAAQRGIYVNKVVSGLSKNKKDSHSLYYDEEKGRYKREREKAHEAILEDFHKNFEHIPSEGKSVFSAGLPGAGKTTVLNMLTEEDGVKPSEYAIVSSDDFKEALAARGMIPKVEGLDPMEASTLVHKESSYLADKFLSQLAAKNKNIIYDFTCKDVKSTSNRMSILEKQGYSLENMQFVFVDIPLEVAQERAIGRYHYGLNNEKDGGRYLPPEVLELNRSKTGKYSSVNAEALNEVYRLNKDKGLLTPIVYDNSGDKRKDPSYNPTKINYEDFLR